MAQQDKTDFYWNGVLSGAINNLYYDLINVDVVHVPYATTHRNSSFFLKTRLAYSISQKWEQGSDTSWYEVTDVKILWDEDCDNSTWTVYVMWRKWQKKAIFMADIVDDNSNWIGCVGDFSLCTDDDMRESVDCWNRKLFTTDYVKWERYQKWSTIWSNDKVLKKNDWATTEEATWLSTWIQKNEYTLWTTVWLFTDENVVNWYAHFVWSKSWETTEAWAPWNYLLVYQSRNLDGDGIAWQVRMITWFDNEWRIVLDSPWLYLDMPDTTDLKAWEKKYTDGGGWVAYAIFKEWWEVVGFTNNKHVEIIYDKDSCSHMTVYDQSNGDGSAKWKIVWVASTTNKVFVLTQNGYIHYNKDTGWWNKFLINDDMYAWVDKIAITSYRDMVLAFWRKHIAIWVPDDQNKYWTMYDQSTTIGLWSGYSFAEYDWDLLFVSNDKRLLALWVSATAWRYMLQHEDVWDMINWKLSSLRPWDEVYIWNDNNNLRVFVNYNTTPFVKDRRHANLAPLSLPTTTHIYKFDTLFKVWTEDHINWILIKWATEGIYYWEDWIYVRDDATTDAWWQEYTTTITAYLIENENNWLEWRPTLFQVAKLNRLITTLWPWIYTDASRIKITNYSKGIWYTYQFPINWDWNDWLWLMSSYYLEEDLDEEQLEKITCMLSSLQDGQIKYQPNCSEWNVQRQYIAQNAPWCEDYDELLTESHWVCINDKLYELAPTMPLTTSLGENQPYSTQIKIELIWWQGDVICFGWRLAEMYIAPLFLTWPDWEYQLEPNTACR